jgi:transposase
MSNRKKYSPEFKAKVALCAIKGEKTIAELSSHYQVHSSIIVKWKSALIKNASNAFDSSKSDNNKNDNTLSLNAKIGELLMERDFLKKTLKMF